MRKRNKKQIAILVLKIFLVIVALGLVLFFAFRNTLLEKAITRISGKMDREYNTTFTVNKASFKGFSGIEMEGIYLVPKNADTLLQVRELKTSVNLGALLTGDVQLGTLI